MVEHIRGLYYFPNFIDEQRHDHLLNMIDQQPWLTDLKRRVQHYGYKYDYRSKSIDESMKVGPLPSWADEIAQELYDGFLANPKPDQMIVNEYQPGQGINNHIDCIPCFEEWIASLSLGSACVMNFLNKSTGDMLPLILEPRSLIVLCDDARYGWMHGIPARKVDKIGDQVITRERRVSLTFRKVIV